MAGAAAFNTLEWEAVLKSQLAGIVLTVAPREVEFDSARLTSKFTELLGKAAKSSAPIPFWQEAVGEFCRKFYESLWNSMGDRDWLNEVDFTLCVGVAIQTYGDPSVLKQSPNDEEYIRYVHEVGSKAFDNSRYQNCAWQVVKQIITNKASSKKVSEALDTTRDEVVKETHVTMVSFIWSWIIKTVKFFSKDGGGNPKYHLTVEEANKLFNALIKDGGGVPLWLMQAAPSPPPPEWDEVKQAVDKAYEGWPDPYNYTKKHSDWNNEPQMDEAQMQQMMGMMQQMMDMMGKEGGAKGKGCDFGKGKGKDGFGFGKGKGGCDFGKGKGKDGCGMMGKGGCDMMGKGGGDMMAMMGNMMGQMNQMGKGGCDPMGKGGCDMMGKGGGCNGCGGCGGCDMMGKGPLPIMDGSGCGMGGGGCDMGAVPKGGCGGCGGCGDMGKGKVGLGMFCKGGGPPGGCDMGGKGFM